MTREVLDHRAGNLLGAALVADRAARLGIRIVFVKGISLEFHRLRKNHISADVDVLVEQGRAMELVANLASDAGSSAPCLLRRPKCPRTRLRLSGTTGQRT